MKDIIVMCPTVKRARYEFDRFCWLYESIITNKKLYETTLVNGQKIMFRGETEGQKVLRGTHAEIIMIDEFPMVDVNEGNKIDKLREDIKK